MRFPAICRASARRGTRQGEDELTWSALPSGIESFCVRQYPRLVGAITLYCGDPGVAEELAQEALLKACRHWPRVSAMAAPGAWVHRVAMNLANSHYRHRAAERRALQKSAGGSSGPVAMGDGAEALAIRDVVQRLPERQRAAVILRYYADLSAAEAGQVLGLSENAARQLTFRGMSSLRTMLDRDEMEGALDGV